MFQIQSTSGIVCPGVTQLSLNAVEVEGSGLLFIVQFVNGWR